MEKEITNSLKNLLEKNLIYKDDEWSIQSRGFASGIWHNCRIIDTLPGSYSSFSATVCNICKKDIPNHVKVTAKLLEG